MFHTFSDHKVVDSNSASKLAYFDYQPEVIATTRHEFLRCLAKLHHHDLPWRAIYMPALSHQTFQIENHFLPSVLKATTNAWFMRRHINEHVLLTKPLAKRPNRSNLMHPSPAIPRISALSTKSAQCNFAYTPPKINNKTLGLATRLHTIFDTAVYYQEK